MKSYTDIEQIQKLAGILPIETADMWVHPYWDDVPNIGNADLSSNQIPCWSLAALLNLIPDSIYNNTDNFAQLEITKRSLGYHNINDNIVIGTLAGNLVDACYEMVVKLDKLNLL